MLLLAHAMTGVMIGQKINNPITVSLLAFASHFLLDWIPHWNYYVPKKFELWEYAKAFPDFATSALIYIVYLFSNPLLWLPITLGVIFACLPDFLTLTRYIPILNSIFRRLNNLHGKVQRHSDHPRQITRGLLYQIGYIIIILHLGTFI